MSLESYTHSHPVLKEAYIPQHSNFISSLRTLFATSIASSFSRIQTKRLVNWLDLSEDEVKQWAESAQWKVEGDLVLIPGNGDNDVKAGVVKENVELSRELRDLCIMRSMEGAVVREVGPCADARIGKIDRERRILDVIVETCTISLPRGKALDLDERAS